MQRIAKTLHRIPVDAFTEQSSIVKTGGVANQAILRRAVSTAYYAAFHALIEYSVDTIAGESPPALCAALARTFDHTAMKKFARSLSSGAAKDILKGVFGTFPPELKALTKSFATLQEERETADYDLSVSVSLETVASAITDMQRIMLILIGHKKEPIPEIKSFLVLLPVIGQLHKR